MAQNKLNDGGQSDLFVSDAPSVAVIAGFGSGKTHAVWMKIFNWMNEFPDVSHGYFAPTYALIRDIFVPVVTEFCADNGIACEFRKSESKMYVQGYKPIYCRSMQNPETIVGFEIGNAAVDEIDILQLLKAWEAWRKIKARCRKKLYRKGKKKKKKNQVPNQMALASTPEGYKFAYQAFKKDPLDNSALFQMSTYSNEKNLPVGYIQELLANYPPQLVDAYILGKFTNLTQGRVYTSFDRALNNAIGIYPFKGETIHIGMDFNVQRMAAIIHVNRMTSKHLGPVACGEIVNALDTPTMIKAIKELYPTNSVIVYPDASGDNRDTQNASSSDLKLLKLAGFVVKSRNANPRIKDRVLSMNGMFCNALGERKYLVNVNACPKYTENLEQQAYDKNGLPDKDSDTDHTNDAGGYFIHSEYGIIKPDSKVKKLIM